MIDCQAWFESSLGHQIGKLRIFGAFLVFGSSEKLASPAYQLNCGIQLEFTDYERFSHY
jgi:hypothetical protein